MSMDFFWEQFGVECAEHLQMIDRLLSAAMDGPVNTDGISQLFRSMHSIKGLSKAMGITGMESIAHRCEDILGLVRDNGVTLTSELVQLLMRANDTLARLHETVTAQRADQEVDKAFLISLDNAFQKYSRGDVPAEEPAADEPVAEEEEDPFDALLKALANLRPDVSAMVERIATAALDANASALPRPALKELKSLAVRCEEAGLSALADALQALNVEMTRKIPQTDTDRITKLALIGQELREMETAFSVDLGGSSLSLRPPAHGEAMAQAIAGPLSELPLGTNVDDLSEDALADALAALWDGLRVLDRLLVFADDRNAEALLCDRLSVVTGGDDLAAGFKDLLVTLDGIRDGLFDRLVSIDESPDSFDFRAALGAGELAAAAAAVEEAAAEHGFDVPRFLHEHGLHDEFVLCISHDYYDALEAVEHGDLNALLITIDLNGDPASARQFLNWTRANNLRSISRSVIADEETLFEFLIFTPDPPTELIRELEAAVGPAIIESRVVTRLDEATQAQVAAEAVPSAPTPVVVSSSAEGGGASTTSVAPTPAMTQLRVSAAVLDSFMAQVGCLVGVRSRLSVMLQDDRLGRLLDSVGDLSRRLQARGMGEEVGIVEELRNVLHDNRTRLQGVQSEFQRHLSMLQETALDLRVLPLSNLFARLPRIVRDLGAAQGKDVRFVMTGGETVVDKSVIETLVDPLIHIVRNAVDHGIEVPADRIAAGKAPQAMLTLSAVQEGGEAKLSIIDDGRGINVERVAQKALERGLVSADKIKGLSREQIMQFIFEPGFSTAAAITETSGRGVGMDIVRTAVIGIGGKVSVSSQAGQGSRFDITIPISAAIQNTLVVRLGEHHVGIPSRYVDEVHQVTREEIRDLHDQKVHLLRGHVLPLYNLNTVLMGGKDTERDRVLFVVVSAGGRRMGLVVDSVVRREEMFLTKPHPLVRRSPYLFSATVSGDGKLILIVDVDGLMGRMAQSGL